MSYAVGEQDKGDEDIHDKSNLAQDVGPYTMEHRHVGTKTTLANFTRALPPTWLLLDSCSTTNLISNKDWLDDIHDDGTNITI